ncbi:nucleocapsid protein [Daphne virus 1]|nr:nucleocapsid protein [Daphne virus 1]
MATREERLAKLRNKISAKPLTEEKTNIAPASAVKTLPRYDDLETVKVTINNAPKAWDDADLSKIKIYTVRKLKTSEIIRLGKSVFDRIEQETFTTSDVDIILSLAVSILEPGCDPNKPTYILTELPASMGSRFKEVVTSISESRNESLSSAMASVAKLRSRLENEPDEERKAVIQAAMEKIEGKMAEMGEDDVPIDDLRSAFIYPFLAAYILRLYAKTPDSWTDKMSLAKQRAATWYDIQLDLLNEISISKVQAGLIREALARKPEICSTWVMLCAHAENNPKHLSVSSLGILKYMALQMFAYTAMHAYSFVVQIQAETGVSFKILLSELDCPATRSGVREIANIIRRYELTEAHPNRKTYFRYARVWDPGYFSHVQTSNCKMLAYVAGKVLGSLSSKGMTNPTDVYALKGLDVKLISTLDQVSDNLYNLLIKSTTNDEESGSSWKI